MTRDRTVYTVTRARTTVKHAVTVTRQYGCRAGWTAIPMRHLARVPVLVRHVARVPVLVRHVARSTLCAACGPFYAMCGISLVSGPVRHQLSLWSRAASA